MFYLILALMAAAVAAQDAAECTADESWVVKALKDAIESSGVKVDSFVHVGVVGGDDDGPFKEFTFQDPEGTGRSTWGLDFTVKTYKASELVAISGEEQECLEATPLGDKEVYTQKRAVGGDNPWITTAYPIVLRFVEQARFC